MSAKPVKSVPGSLTVYDAEKESWVEIDHETQKQAARINQQIQVSSLMTALLIKDMFDKRLYLALGATSRDEYIDTMTPFGRSQAYKLYAVANSFELSAKSLNIPLLIEDGSIKVDEKVQSTGLSDFASLGVEKLYSLTGLEDDDLKSLMKDGKALLKDGREISVQEMMDMSAKHVSRIISENKQKYTNKITQLDEQVKLLKSDVKEKDKLIENLSKANEHAEKIEKTYGPVASRIKDKTERLAEAKELLNEFTQVLVRSGVTVDDPDELQFELKSIVKSVNEVHVKMQGNFAEVLDNEF
jgi:hypothetical protein